MGAPTWPKQARPHRTQPLLTSYLIPPYHKYRDKTALVPVLTVCTLSREVLREWASREAFLQPPPLNPPHPAPDPAQESVWQSWLPWALRVQRLEWQSTGLRLRGLLMLKDYEQVLEMRMSRQSCLCHFCP